jgi:UDP-N-acetylglucosamine 2-epimerase (non-hydrolysing)/UDP-GlcNAc3NAcA epimerase
MKIATVIGARPQFIKAAVVSECLENEIVIHTGQHYDYNMSDVFFEELGMKKPAYNLGISGGTHGKMTGEMLIRIEEILLKEKPDYCLVYGDTNSTLAGALSAVKLHIPVVHVEAGLRFGTLNNPEEVNRVCTDKISSLLLCPTENAVKNLANENVKNNVYFTGDPMYDAFVKYSKKSRLPKNIPDKFYYLTCHREENSSVSALTEIFKAMDMLEYPVIYPVHPRNKEKVKQVKSKNVIFIEPVSYFESLALINNCEKVVTDSGGLQREAFWAKKQCITLLDNILWQETHINNCNQLSKCDCNEISEKLSEKVTFPENYAPFGDGHSAEKIAKHIASLGK